jgi:hypothetical protein
MELVGWEKYVYCLSCPVFQFDTSTNRLHSGTSYQNDRASGKADAGGLYGCGQLARYFDTLTLPQERARRMNLYF